MRARVIALLVAGLVAVGVTVLATYDPGASRLYPPCPMHALTGLFCPGCGSLRALHALLHGELAAAVRQNALMMVFLPFIGAALLRRGARAFVPAVTRPTAHAGWADKALLAAILVWGILRNLPFRPFELLAPR